MPKICCDRMDSDLEQACPDHSNRYDCPDAIVARTRNGFGLIVHDGGSSAIAIGYCPWCGKKLPTIQSSRPTLLAFRVRTATPDDRRFMFDQATRLAAAADVPWHAEGDLFAFQHRYMNVAFARPTAEIATFIAEDESAARLGFVHVESSTDSVTLEPCAYVTVLAVTEAAQGQGVAAQLMAAAEDWARAQGFRLIGLDVFVSNRRARAFYARLGYQDDSLRVTKPLQYSET